MKKIVKKPVAKKPMMKSGGAKKSLRKYQGNVGGSEVGPTPSGSTAKAAPAKSFSDYYKDNVAAGLPERKARKIAMVEAGVKDPKHRVDPNAVINAVGNTAGAIGQAASAFRPQPSGSPMKKGGTMKKLGCAKCGKMMSKGGVKKMKAGGSTDVNISKPGAGYAKPTEGDTNQKYFIYGMPTTNTANAGIATMKKGGAMKKKMAKGGSTFGMLSVKAGVDNNPNATAADRIAGATKKAKFGATVKVQRSPKAGKVRSAGDQGYASVGQREPGRVIKKTLSKKAQGGPIIDKLKAKLAERKVTKTIKKSVKSSGKRVK